MQHKNNDDINNNINIKIDIVQETFDNLHEERLENIKK